MLSTSLCDYNQENHLATYAKIYFSEEKEMEESC